MFNPNDLSYFARAMAMRGGMPGYSGMMRGQGLLSGPFNGNLQGAPIPQMPPWFQRPGSVSYGPGPAPMQQSPQPMPQAPMQQNVGTNPYAQAMGGGFNQAQGAMGINGSPYQGNFGGQYMNNGMQNYGGGMAQAAGANSAAMFGGDINAMRNYIMQSPGYNPNAPQVGQPAIFGAAQAAAPAPYAQNSQNLFG